MDAIRQQIIRRNGGVHVNQRDAFASGLLRGDDGGQRGVVGIHFFAACARHFLRKDGSDDKMSGTGFTDGPDELIARRGIKAVCTGHEQDDVGLVFLEHVHDAGNFDFFDAERREHVRECWHDAAFEDARVAEAGEAVVMGIKLGIDRAIATVRSVAEFTDEIERDAGGAEFVLERLAPSTALRMREAGGFAVFLREVRAAGDTVTEREDAKGPSIGFSGLLWRGACFESLARQDVVVEAGAA